MEKKNFEIFKSIVNGNKKALMSPLALISVGNE
jgi:hypothetical protein